MLAFDLAFSCTLTYFLLQGVISTVKILKVYMLTCLRSLNALCVVLLCVFWAKHLQRSFERCCDSLTSTLAFLPGLFLAGSSHLLAGALMAWCQELKKCKPIKMDRRQRLLRVLGRLPVSPLKMSIVHLCHDFAQADLC